MKNTFFTKYFAFAMFSLFLISCDKDFNSIGSYIIGGENYDFMPGQSFTVKAYNQKVTALQTNNLPINQLGITNNSLFGKTVANFATQLSLVTTAPTFGENIEIDSVVLNIPYFSKEIKRESGGYIKYKLDSIYTTDPISSVDTNYKPINLKIFRTDYQLNDYDPNNLEVAQKYYSDQDGLFSSRIASIQLNNSANLSQNENFVPDSRQQKRFKIKSEKNTTNPNFYIMEHTRLEEIDKRAAPAMRLSLDKDYFKNFIMEAPASKLINNNIFKSYFGSLYFQVEDADQGSLMSLDFAKGSITIYYKEDLIVTKTVNNVTTNIGNDRPLKEFTMAMSGISVNLFNKTDAPGYTTAINAAHGSGHPNLYLKGGEGSTAIVEIFNNDPLNPNELQNLKDKKVLVNDASLYLTVNQGLMNQKYEPLRIYLFDIDNNKVIYDYNFDNSVVGSNPKRNKIMFGGLIKDGKNDDGEDIRMYRIRITEHVNRILKGDQGNVRLGLVVTENINNPSYGYLKTPISSGNYGGNPKELKTLPVGSICSPLGTVLYGTNAGVNSIKFKITYTEPK